jgi:porin
MRGLVVFVLCLGLLAPALAQQDKKTNDLKPADPDTGESTVEETTLGLCSVLASARRLGEPGRLRSRH